MKYIKIIPFMIKHTLRLRLWRFYFCSNFSKKTRNELLFYWMPYEKLWKVSLASQIPFRKLNHGTNFYSLVLLHNILPNRPFDSFKRWSKTDDTLWFFSWSSEYLTGMPDSEQHKSFFFQLKMLLRCICRRNCIIWKKLKYLRLYLCLNP